MHIDINTARTDSIHKFIHVNHSVVISMEIRNNYYTQVTNTPF